jgi:type IV pilus assembly protein PilA
MKTKCAPEDLKDLNINNSRHSRNEKGFTLIELLIVMSLILILMTLAVPQMLKLTKTAHETSAMQSLRTIVQAELQYNSQYPANGFSCSLQQLGGDPKSGAPSAQAAQLIESGLASGNKAGYSFNITNCTKVTVNNQDMYTGYEVTAVPNSVGKSGDRGFCADENNKLTFDPTGGTNCTQPVQ